MTALELPILEVRNLRVSIWGDGVERSVVSDVSFKVGQGRTLGIVGESGCGKTMTALSIMALLPAAARASGSIRLEQTELLDLSPSQWRKVRGAAVSMIFQEPMTALNPVMTIGQQIGEVLIEHERLSKRTALERATELLNRVGIPSARQRAKDYPHQLSGGMRQRAMIAMALACEPKLLVADEPTTALDVTVQAQILDLMLTLQQQMGMAIQFISHNLGVISELADDIIVMYAGRIVEQARSQDLFASPLHPYTRGLISTIPDLEGRAERLPIIPGAVPSRLGTISGCSFAARCSLATSTCRGETPQLIEVEPNHFVACFEATK